MKHKTKLPTWALLREGWHNSQQHPGPFVDCQNLACQLAIERLTNASNQTR